MPQMSKLWRGDVNSRDFRTEALCESAGLKPAMLRAWRNQNNLMPHTEQPPNLVGRQYRWTDYSFIDICVARLVVELTEHGLGTKEAVEFADRFGRLHLAAVLDGRNAARGLVGFSRSKGAGYEPIAFTEKDSVRSALNKAKGAALTVIDLQAIIDQVLKALGVRLVDEPTK